jgi:hypothetical protein
VLLGLVPAGMAAPRPPPPPPPPPHHHHHHHHHTQRARARDETGTMRRKHGEVQLARIAASLATASDIDSTPCRLCSTSTLASPTDLPWGVVTILPTSIVASSVVESGTAPTRGASNTRRWICNHSMIMRMGRVIMGVAV